MDDVVVVSVDSEYTDFGLYDDIIVGAIEYIVWGIVCDLEVLMADAGNIGD